MNRIDDPHSPGGVRAHGDGLPALILERVAATAPPNTRRCWASRWRRYAHWCAQQGHEPLPATSTLLTGFLAYLAEQGLKGTSLDAHLSSLMAVIRLWTQAESERRAADPRAAHDPALAPALPDTAAARAYVIERKHRDNAPREASALYPPQVTAVIDAMRPASRAFLRDRALILLGFALGRRSEQIVGIDLEDLHESQDGRALRVWLPARGDGRRTGRRERITVPAATDPRYCPVRAVRQWRAALRERGYDRGPLFPRLDRLGGIGAAAMTAARRRSHDDGRLLPYTVALILRRHAAAAGLSGPAADPSRKISTHSLRRGFVVSAFARGADPVSVARHAGFADTSRSMAGYVKPGTGWDRNPAAGVFDQPTAVPPAEPVDAAAETGAGRERRAVGAWIQPALWNQAQPEP